MKLTFVQKINRWGNKQARDVVCCCAYVCGRCGLLDNRFFAVYDIDTLLGFLYTVSAKIEYG